MQFVSDANDDDSRWRHVSRSPSSAATSAGSRTADSTSKTERLWGTSDGSRSTHCSTCSRSLAGTAFDNDGGDGVASGASAC
jgi:hypothetical protein